MTCPPMRCQADLSKAEGHKLQQIKEALTNVRAADHVTDHDRH